MSRDFDDDSLFFGLLIARAERLAILSFIAELCEQARLVDPDGLSVPERFFKQRKTELESLFRNLEDSNPTLAARLHEQYEKVRNSIGNDFI
jgi:hypothetical protein